MQLNDTTKELHAPCSTAKPPTPERSSAFEKSLKIGIVRELQKQSLITKDEAERIIEVIKKREV